MMIGTVLRIMVMEYRYDTLRRHTPAQIRKSLRLRRMLHRLANYCDRGQWLRDYAADEQGLLPPWLKRGVLSEDGLYNLLCDQAQEDSEETP